MCKITYKRFGEVTSIAESKRKAEMIVAEKLLLKIKNHDETKIAINKIISNKLLEITSKENLEFIKFLPKTFYPMCGEVENFFGIKVNKFRLAQALTTKRQSRYTKLSHNDGLSLCGAHLTDYFLMEAAGRYSVGTSGLSPKFCSYICRNIDLYNMSKCLLPNLDPRSSRLEGTFVKAVISSLFLFDPIIFFDKFPKIVSNWFEQNKNKNIEFNQKEKLDLSSFDIYFSYVTELQQYIQKDSMDLPVYNTIKSGPDHSPTFQVSCEYKSHKTIAGGKKGKEARNKSAYKMLKLVVKNNG